PGSDSRKGTCSPAQLRKWPRPSLARRVLSREPPALASAGPPPPGSRRGPRGAALGPVPAPLQARRREEARLPYPGSGWDRGVWAADGTAPAVSAKAAPTAGADGQCLPAPADPAQPSSAPSPAPAPA
ncbi:unnamed protein product, partial [Gulo gulo]